MSDLRESKQNNEGEFSLEDILEEFGSKGAAREDTPSAAEVLDTAAETAEVEDLTPEKPEVSEVTASAGDTGDLKRVVADAIASMPDDVVVSEEKEDTKSFAPRKKTQLRVVTEPEPEKCEEKVAEETAERPEFVPEEPEGAPEFVPLEQVLSETVESILEEDDGIIDERIPLSVRLGEMIQRLHAHKAQKKREDLWEKPEVDPEPEEPEMDLEDAAREAKRKCKKTYRQMLLGCVPMGLLVLCAFLHELKLLPELWFNNALLRCGVCGGLLIVELAFVSEIWAETIEQLKMRRMNCVGAAILAAAVAIGGCIYGAVGGACDQLPLCAPAGVLLWLCVYGQVLSADANAKAFRLVDIGGEPPYAVAVTRAGACKQNGQLDGFYRTTMKANPAQRWQVILVPFLLAAATILSCVVCLSNKDMEHFLWVWSAMLCASLPLALPLTGTLPLAYLNRRLSKSGSAVAGYYGARAVSVSKRMVLTDSDLFPPGTIGINGLKVYGEEIGKVVSYAATVTQAAKSQLNPLFEQLLAAEGGCHLELSDLHYYEEGGVGGTIRGETVTMGSAYFMRKNHVALPHDLKLKTGMFLAVDGTLIAVFAIKYQPSRNVEWALRAMRRSRITPVLAVRSSIITPPLLKRKFNLNAKPIYPDISTRLALSELSDELAKNPNAVIYREGLMPFAETVIGSRRMTKAVRLSTWITYIGAVCGLLLSYYLTNVGNFEALSSLRMVVFMLLWTLPTFLLSGLIKHY